MFVWKIVKIGTLFTVAVCLIGYFAGNSAALFGLGLRGQRTVSRGDRVMTVNLYTLLDGLFGSLCLIA